MRTMDRDALLDLLRKNHTFPGPYELRAVVRPDSAPLVVSAVAAALGEGERVVRVDERRSRNGNYVALHVQMLVLEPERILDAYEVLKGIDGVMATL